MSSLPLLSHRLFAAAAQQRPVRPRRAMPERRPERFTGLATAVPVELLPSYTSPGTAPAHSVTRALALA